MKTINTIRTVIQCFVIFLTFENTVHAEHFKIQTHSDILATSTRGPCFLLTQTSIGELQNIAEAVAKAFNEETYFDDWCEARAYLISQYSARRGINNGSLFVEEYPNYVVNPRTGDTLYWNYHVTTIFYGDDGQLYVIDPFFLNPLMTLDVWLSYLAGISGYKFSEGVLTLPPASATIDFASPYVYEPPIYLDDYTLDGLRGFDAGATDEAIADYPNASAALGISKRNQVPKSLHSNLRWIEAQ